MVGASKKSLFKVPISHQYFPTKMSLDENDHEDQGSGSFRTYCALDRFDRKQGEGTAQERLAFLNCRLCDRLLLTEDHNAFPRFNLPPHDLWTVVTLTQHDTLSITDTDSTTSHIDIEQAASYAIRRIQDKKSADEQHRKGQDALERGDRKTALECFQRGLDQAPNHSAIKYTLRKEFFLWEHEGTSSSAKQHGRTSQDEFTKERVLPREVLVRRSLFGNAESVPIDPKYPLLPPTDEDEEGDGRKRFPRKRRRSREKKKRKKERTKQRHHKSKRKKRHGRDDRQPSSESEIDSGDDSSSIDSDRRHKRRQKRLQRGHSDEEDARCRKKRAKKSDQEREGQISCDSHNSKVADEKASRTAEFESIRDKESHQHDNLSVSSRENNQVCDSESLSARVSKSSLSRDFTTLSRTLTMSKNSSDASSRSWTNQNSDYSGATIDSLLLIRSEMQRFLSE